VGRDKLRGEGNRLHGSAPSFIGGERGEGASGEERERPAVASSMT
jgi:hypothetical protein